MNHPGQPDTRVVDQAELSKARIRKRRWLYWIPATFCVACAGLILLAENIPSFIAFAISPPADGYGIGEWTENTYALRLNPLGKDFVWRRSADFANGPKGTQTWNTIVGYFDARLRDQGYVRDQGYSDCNVYLPEARFIQSGENGYVHYRHKGYIPMENNGAEDLVCLAVWVTGRKGDGTPNTFAIVLVTVRASLLDHLNSIL